VKLFALDHMDPYQHTSKKNERKHTHLKNYLIEIHNYNPVDLGEIKSNFCLMPNSKYCKESTK